MGQLLPQTTYPREVARIGSRCLCGRPARPIQNAKFSCDSLGPECPSPDGRTAPVSRPSARAKRTPPDNLLRMLKGLPTHVAGSAASRRKQRGNCPELGRFAMQRAKRRLRPKQIRRLSSQYRTLSLRLFASIAAARVPAPRTPAKKTAEKHLAQRTAIILA